MVAQLAEHRTSDLKEVGSIPVHIFVRPRALTLLGNKQTHTVQYGSSNGKASDSNPDCR